ncbi:MAG: monofunctional biosynthetic peptidoglycan transglycosylase [Pseudomonadota bacterium]
MSRNPPGLLRRFIGLVLKLILYFVLLSLALVLLFKFVNPPTTITMLTDTNGATRQWSNIGNIDRDMVSAVIAAEDSKFCSHNGFDQEAIVEAMERNAKGGRLRGASTISQQTAKNVFLWQDGGYVRKALEAWFTLLIEQIWGKERIMEVYLNIAETGIGTYGVEAGAQRYFNKGASSLSRSEAARMAAALPLPKERAVINPTGFTRRYGNTIAARIAVVQRDKLDSCAR